jgi:ATP-dependent DNA ligase
VGSLGETGPKEDMEKFVGRVAEIKAYGQYPTGALRHPVLERWREDKLPEDCVFDFGGGK